VWHELRNFIEKSLNLPCDEFNAVPSAGIPIPVRLEQMLDDATFAFLVLTAEDELADGKVQARMKVVHEAGLFQGRLGFRKAIIVLEEGCEKFSNIEGLGDIRFPRGSIKSAFNEVREVLEREGTIQKN
jgi:predicted nucleotide-binding protein